MNKNTLILVSISALAIFNLFQFGKYQKFTYSTQALSHQLEQDLKSKIEALHSDLSVLQDKQQAQAQHLSDRSQVTFIQLSEVGSLLSLASFHLEISKDVKSALFLLKGCEEKVKALQAPHLAPLLQAIQDDIQALEKITLRAPADLWLTLDTLATQLAPIAPKTLSTAMPPAPPEAPTPAGWKEKLYQSLDKMKALVKIRNQSEPLQPVLAEAHSALIQDTLRALLEQARLAVLTQDDTIYQRALQQTLQYLGRYYEESTEEVVKLEEALRTLQSYSLMLKLPSLKSLEQMKTVR